MTTHTSADLARAKELYPENSQGFAHRILETHAHKRECAAFLTGLVEGRAEGYKKAKAESDPLLIAAIERAEYYQAEGYARAKVELAAQGIYWTAGPEGTGNLDLIEPGRALSPTSPAPAKAMNYKETITAIHASSAPGAGERAKDCARLADRHAEACERQAAITTNNKLFWEGGASSARTIAKMLRDPEIRSLAVAPDKE